MQSVLGNHGQILGGFLVRLHGGVLPEDLHNAWRSWPTPGGILGRLLWGSLARISQIAWGTLAGSLGNSGKVFLFQNTRKTLAKGRGHSWAIALERPVASLAKHSGESRPKPAGHSCTTTLGNPSKCHANCLGDLGKFLEGFLTGLQNTLKILAKAWGHSWATALGSPGRSFAKCLGNHGQNLGAFLGDCLGESWGKSC